MARPGESGESGAACGVRGTVLAGTLLHRQTTIVFRRDLRWQIARYGPRVEPGSPMQNKGSPNQITSYRRALPPF